MLLELRPTVMPAPFCFARLLSKISVTASSEILESATSRNVVLLLCSLGSGGGADRLLQIGNGTVALLSNRAKF